MTTRRHKRSEERDQAKAEELAEDIRKDFLETFPNATCWVIFCSVQAQLMTKGTAKRKRLKRYEEVLNAFLKSPNQPPEANEDILVIQSADSFMDELVEFIIAQRMLSGPLNYGPLESDPQPEAKIAYESYWTE